MPELFKIPDASWYKRARKAAKLTQEQLGSLLGVTGSAVSQWERGGGIELEHFFMLLEHYEDLALRRHDEVLWEIMKVGSRLAPGSDDLDEDGQRWDTTRVVPLISKVAAGQWGDAADPYPVGKAEKFIGVDDEYGEGTFALTVDGESMLPRFLPGDLIVVDPAVEPTPGDFVVAKREADDEATFKQYKLRYESDVLREIELSPLNDAWPRLVIDRDHPGRVVGVMVEHRSYRRR